MSNSKKSNSKEDAGKPLKASTRHHEEEPVSPERSAKVDRNFVTVESQPIKKKKSVPADSTAQRGKTPVSTSDKEKKNRDAKD